MLPPRRTNLPKSSMLAGNGSSAENRIGPPLRRSQLDWKPLNRQIPALTGRSEVFKSPSCCCCSCSSRRVLNTLTDTHIPSCPQQSTSSQPTPSPQATTRRDQRHLAAESGVEGTLQYIQLSAVWSQLDWVDYFTWKKKKTIWDPNKSYCSRVSILYVV